MANIKLEIHELIDKIENDKVLQSVYAILSDQALLHSTDGELLSHGKFEEMIDEGESDIASGKIHSHESVKAHFKSKMNE